MIIKKQYTYNEFKEAQKRIECLPALDNNVFIFTNVLSVDGKSCTVKFEYCIFDEKWIYESKLNKGA
tara:strand:- start:563 stop:763 length:201 start_codon:yes stop_codon:yes gene_type:complete